MNIKTIEKGKRETIVEEELDGEREYVVGDDAQLTLLFVQRTAFNPRRIVRLVGAGASAMIRGIVIGHDAWAGTLHTMQLHEAPNTKSNLLVKSVLFDHSTFFYDGVIRVEKRAQKTDAYQRNENLLLSPDAHAESKPALEILADDVRCTHGATVAPLNKEMLWYLRSRGIGEVAAQQLLIEGFLESALECIDNTHILDQLRRTIWTNS